jgi:hypothetical protein
LLLCKTSVGFGLLSRRLGTLRRCSRLARFRLLRLTTTTNVNNKNTTDHRSSTTRNAHLLAFSSGVDFALSFSIGSLTSTSRRLLPRLQHTQNVNNGRAHTKCDTTFCCLRCNLPASPVNDHSSTGRAVSQIAHFVAASSFSYVHAYKNQSTVFFFRFSNQPHKKVKCRCTLHFHLSSSTAAISFDTSGRGRALRAVSAVAPLT